MNLTIITVNRNNRKGLADTIKSVSAQTVPPYEFLVIDGASDDGSVDVIRQNQDSITKWVSEPDKGIYNAMNKGIDLATGDWCLFLNSGDRLCNEKVLERILETGADADIICGSTIILENPPRKFTPAESVTLNTLYERAINHQSALIRTTILKKYHYDETYKICADRKLFTQALIFDNCSYAPIDVDIADYDIDGFSSRNRTLSELEKARVMEELLPQRILEDYGRIEFGALYGTSDYEKLFIEIGQRNYRKPIYQIVRSLLLIASWFVPSARFVKNFPRRLS